MECSRASWTLGGSFYRPKRKFTSVGSQKMAGSGGDDVLPSKSVGRLRRASRDLVKVYGWLNWIVVDWVGSLPMEVIFWSESGQVFVVEGFDCGGG